MLIKRVALLLVFVVCPAYCFAQAQNFDTLSKKLQFGDPNERIAAVNQMLKLKDERGLKTVLSVLQNNTENVGFKIQILNALGKAKEKGAADLLIQGLQYDGPLLTNLKGDERGMEKDFLEALAEALGNIKDARAVKPLVEYGMYRPLPKAFFEALRKIKDPRCVPLLLQKHTYDNSDEVFNIGDTIGVFHDSTTVELLISAINDTDIKESSYNLFLRISLYSLGKIGSPTAVEPLIRFLNNLMSLQQQWLDNMGNMAPANYSFKPDLKQNVITALGEIKDKRAVDALLPCLKDRDSDVRLYTILALEKIGDIRAIEPIIPCLDDKDLNVVRQSDNTLVKFGKAAIPGLKAALNGEDATLKRRAAGVLKELGVKLY